MHRCVELVTPPGLLPQHQDQRGPGPDLPQIIGDPGQLQQVFTNLLLNAADAMSGAGVITITSRAGAWRRRGLQFCDSGCGIPEEIRDKIFEPFFTTKPPGKGTGLGLSIVYGVIQRHGGSIQAYSPPGGGTIFTVTLPLESAEPGPSAGFEEGAVTAVAAAIAVIAGCRP